VNQLLEQGAVDLDCRSRLDLRLRRGKRARAVLRSSLRGRTSRSAPAALAAARSPEIGPGHSGVAAQERRDGGRFVRVSWEGDRGRFLAPETALAASPSRVAFPLFDQATEDCPAPGRGLSLDEVAVHASAVAG